MQKHNGDTIKTSGHFFRKIYLSLYTKWLCVRGELETDQRLQHIDPPAPPAKAVRLPCSPGLHNRGPGGQALWWELVLTPTSSLQLIWTSCRQGYIIIWYPPTSCERHNSHSIQSVDSQCYPPISSTGCTSYLHRCISHLTARLGRRSLCNTNNSV